MATPPESSGAKSPLAVAQKIVAELDGVPKDDQALKRELTRAFLSYLGIEQTNG